MTEFPSTKYRGQNPIRGFENVTWPEVQGGEEIVGLVRHALRSCISPIFIHGRTGCGKSSIAALLTYARPCGRFRRVADLVLDITKSRVGGKHVSDHLTSGFLILDDFGARALTDTASEIILEILSGRAGGTVIDPLSQPSESAIVPFRPTVITSNLSPEQLAAAGVDERIVSRIRGGMVIELTGPDRRIDNGCVVCV